MTDSAEAPRAVSVVVFPPELMNRPSFVGPMTAYEWMRALFEQIRVVDLERCDVTLIDFEGVERVIRAIAQHGVVGEGCSGEVRALPERPAAMVEPVARPEPG